MGVKTNIVIVRTRYRAKDIYNFIIAVLITKLSSARDNPLLMDNYVVKALRTVLLELKESGELKEAYKEHIQSTLESDNPFVAMMMKSIGAYSAIKKSMTDEAIDGMIDSMLGND